MEAAIDVPRPPAGLPAEAGQRWSDAFLSAYRAEMADYPQKPFRWRKAAVKAAGKAVEIPKLESFDDAMKLEPWQFVYREKRTQPDSSCVLQVVTSDGKKYSFPVPNVVS